MKGGFYMAAAVQKWFKARETQENLDELQKVVIALGYKDKSDWYREMKRKTIREYEKRIK